MTPAKVPKSSKSFVTIVHVLSKNVSINPREAINFDWHSYNQFFSFEYSDLPQKNDFGTKSSVASCVSKCNVLTASRSGCSVGSTQVLSSSTTPQNTGN